MPKSRAPETERHVATPPPQPSGLYAEEWESEAQCAKALRRSKSTLRRWRRARKGPPFVVVGREILYRISGRAQWLLKHEQNFDDDNKQRRPRTR